LDLHVLRTGLCGTLPILDETFGHPRVLVICLKLSRRYCPSQILGADFLSFLGVIVMRIIAGNAHRQAHGGLKWILGCAILVGALASASYAQERDPMLSYDANGLKVRGHLQFGLNAVVEDNLFWDLAATTAPTSGFDPNAEWLEGYFKPGLSFEKQLDTVAVLYGKLSAVSSYTWGTDAFDTGDTGATTLEEAYLAIRGDLGGGFSYDLSLGPRELTLGTGMLIANGATSGFERGALKLGPRKAWEQAAIGRLSFGDVTGTAFYIDPNELPSTDGNNELAGLDIRFDDPASGYLGATFVHVLK
jgi:hypothetical protein